jgi:hypothetical protein
VIRRSNLEKQVMLEGHEGLWDGGPIWGSRYRGEVKDKKIGGR